MKAPARTEARFTGRHMLVIMLTFFGVITAVNVTMATFARTSWTGLIVPNSYVASREFNGHAEDARAQAALGWTGTLSLDAGRLAYRLVDAGGDPVGMEGATVTLRRPSHENEDRTFLAVPTANDTVAAQADIADGLWIIRIEAEAPRQWRDVRRIVIRDGVLQ